MADVFSAVEGRNQFLEMFVAQVQHQDPLSPMDQTQILGQLAQFSQVESLETLNVNFETLLNNQLASQNAQLASTGAALIGRAVEAEGNRSGVVESVRQDNGLVLVEVAGNLVPLADITAVSEAKSAS